MTCICVIYTCTTHPCTSTHVYTMLNRYTLVPLMWRKRVWCLGVQQTYQTTPVAMYHYEGWVCMCVYVCVCVYICVYVCMCVYVCVRDVVRDTARNAGTTSMLCDDHMRMVNRNIQSAHAINTCIPHMRSTHAVNTYGQHMRSTHTINMHHHTQLYAEGVQGLVWVRDDGQGTTVSVEACGVMVVGYNDQCCHFLCR